MITVFYDGKCGICAKEIRYYSVIAPSRTFNWQDITVSADLLKQCGISLSQGLKILHALDDHGVLHTGVDAFLLIWRQLSGWRWLSRLVSLPIVYSIARLAYSLFAEWRFNRNQHCRLAVKRENFTVVN